MSQVISTNSSKQQLFFWIVITLSWLAFIPVLLFIHPGFSFACWFVVALWFFIKKSKWKWYLLFFSPWILLPVWNFGSGVVDYTRGIAAIETYGEPSREAGNLDPALRVWSSSDGCMVTGLEIFTQSPNNAAITTCVSLFGYQRGAYAGTYPHLDAAIASLQHAVVVPITHLPNGCSFIYEGKRIQLNTDGGYELGYINAATAAKVTVYRNECLLFEIPAEQNEQVVL